MNPLRPQDYLIASTPTLASLTLEQVNGIVALIGGLLGIAYLVWKWNREIRKG